QRAVKLHGFARLRLNLGIVESALGDENPITGGASELMGKQMGVTDAETAQHDVAFVSLPVAIGIAQEKNLRAMLDVGAIFIWKQPKGNREAVGVDPRRVRAGTVWIVE